MNQEKQRLKQATDGKVPWKNGDHISPNDSGKRCGRITVPMASPGNTFPTMRHGVECIAGVRKALLVSAMTDNGSVFPWHSGMGKTPL